MLSSYICFGRASTMVGGENIHKLKECIRSLLDVFGDGFGSF